MMTINVRKRLGHLSRRNKLSWHYLLNLVPTLSYNFTHPTISGGVASVLQELRRDGVALSSVDGLLGVDSNFAELEENVERLEAREKPLLDRVRKAVREGDS